MNKDRERTEFEAIKERIKKDEKYKNQCESHGVKAVLTQADLDRLFLLERIEKLEDELSFTKEYLNPADTSFRQMIDAFRVLPEEQKLKLINLSKALVDMKEAGL